MTIIQGGHVKDPEPDIPPNYEWKGRRGPFNILGMVAVGRLRGHWVGKAIVILFILFACLWLVDKAVDLAGPGKWAIERTEVVR